MIGSNTDTYVLDPESSTIVSPHPKKSDLLTSSQHVSISQSGRSDSSDTPINLNTPDQSIIPQGLIRHSNRAPRMDYCKLDRIDLKTVVDEIEPQISNIQQKIRCG
ncbi:hypothetical protein ZOSMA_191G00130 [Zostera marina]|uniref:Uncharacterized protein n=1 Tax=Zostera marina TaxID=29655 RepID=A0A0K9PRM1_ZOSMR|nr:hypothetical protein ZOSMA_191G00130 [Zostera marina]